MRRVVCVAMRRAMRWWSCVLAMRVVCVLRHACDACRVRVECVRRAMRVACVRNVCAVCVSCVLRACVSDALRVRAPMWGWEPRTFV
jgi:hypothetical protein